MVVVVGNYLVVVVVEQDNHEIEQVVAAWVVGDKCCHKHAAVEHNYCNIDDFRIDFY